MQRAKILACMGRLDEAAAQLRRGIGQIGGGLSQLSATRVAGVLSVAVMVEDRELASVALDRGVALIAAMIPTLPLFSGSVARVLGGAARLLGKPSEARAYFLQAIQACERARFRPELALTRFQLAELLMEHYPNERAEALDHLDFAVKEFEAMKMAPSLERALRLRERFP